MSKIVAIFLAVCLMAALWRVFDRSMALDDAYQEVHAQTSTTNLLVLVGNYAIGCGDKCDMNSMATEFSAKYAVNRDDHSLQIDAVTVGFVNGKIAKISVLH
jgi:hypothetical protein